MWETCVSVILPEIIMEFDPRYPELLSIGQQVGLVVGWTAPPFYSEVFAYLVSRRHALEFKLGRYRPQTCIQHDPGHSLHL